MKTFIQSGIFCLLILFSVTQNGSAQNESLRFESIGFDQGLANITTSVFQDSKGYIWIGTDDGLNKYDGYSFTKYRFDPLDSNSLSQNWIYTIWEDKQGNIWVGTEDGLCKFDRVTEKFTRYKPLPNASFNDPNICAINEDNSGWMWVGNTSGGLCRFNRKTGKFIEENIELGFAGRHSLISSIHVDHEGTLWISNSSLHSLTLASANKSEPSRVNIKRYMFDAGNPNSISSNFVSAVFEDRAGIIWAATDNGLNSFDKKTGVFTRYQHDIRNPHSISTNDLRHWPWNCIDEDQEGNLWITSANGLNKLNKERTAFTAYYHKQGDGSGLSSPSLTSLTIDRAGIIWVCTLGGGLNKADLNQKKFMFCRSEPGNNNSLSSNTVTAIHEDSSGTVWIGTDGGGLNRWDKNSNKFSHFKASLANPRSLKSDVVNAILEDRHGHLWICNGDVLSLFNKQTGECINYNTSETKHTDRDVIYSITQDREGLIWLGGYGLKSFNEETGEFTHYYHTPGDTTGISDYGAKTVYADSHDNIWVGLGSKGTDKLDKRTGQFIHYKHKPGNSASISSNSVNYFFEDSRGTLWLGTYAGGLCSYDYSTDRFTTYTDKHGLADKLVFAILEDDNNNLWIGTANGLSKFDPRTKQFTNYHHKDGLQSNRFFAGNSNRPSCSKGKDGTLYFGGDNGFNFFDPKLIKGNSAIAPVVITQFKLLDSLVRGAHESKEIILNYNQNYFSFEFSSLSFHNPAKNQYAYKLEGVDEEWIYSGTRRYASYTNIDPGDYVFRVKATNSDGFWNEEGTHVAIRIKPPWWKTWWAYSVYGLLVIAVGFEVHLFQKAKTVRIEREKAQQKELEQAREIEKAYSTLKATQAQLIQSEKMASLGELTAGIAHEIQNPLNFVNNFSELNDELLSELKGELSKGKIDEAIDLANDAIENQKKINHHGKRADAIVKGMLQHSRASSGTKEPIDINALCDEYLRLAYHGLRAKDKTFNAKFETNFDSTIEKINVIPQDIGRVILNLINNAFYAVTEKQKQNLNGFEPTVSISTKKLDVPLGRARPDDMVGRGKVEIKIVDNGDGIPDHIRDKIFQPFFTTKPTGQGTGLGLSLSYDIIKAHGGELLVEAKEGKGATFTIRIPLT
jgi:ligand-binding sensor domain-containing protein/signal transduction histidine kinase